LKKYLRILLCSAVSLLASYVVAGEPPSIDFDSTDLWGATPGYPLNEYGQVGGPTYWFYRGNAAENESLIRGFKTGEVRPVSKSTGFMAVSAATNLLFRSLTALAEEGAEAGPRKSGGLSVSPTGLFLDMYVKIHATTEWPDPAEVLASGDKLQMCFYRADMDDGSPPALIVSAGSIRADGSLCATNFVATNVVSIGSWHRLTARLIANAATVSGVTRAGMAIYIDGAPVACTPTDYQVIGEGAAARFAGNSWFATRSLFPVLQESGLRAPLSAQKLYGFGMGGEMQVDEFVVTETNPLGGESYDSIELVLSCDDTMLDALAYRRNGSADQPLAKPFDGSRLTVYPGDEIELVPTPAANVTLDPLRTVGNELAVESCSGWKIVFTGGATFVSGDRVTAVMKGHRLSYSVDGQTFETFRAAVDFANSNGVSNVISLRGDVRLDASPTSDNGQAWVRPGQDVVIDLCGRTISGDHFRREAAVYSQGALEIIDSVGGGAIAAVGSAIEVVSTNDALDVNYDGASVMLGRETATNLFSVLGRVRVSDERSRLVVKIGDYLTPRDGTDDTTFYLKPYLSDRATTVRHEVAGTGVFWRVGFTGNFRVTFEPQHGVAEPPVAYVPRGATVDAPTLTAPGYALEGWYEKGGDPSRAWVFGVGGTPVSNDVTLVARQTLETYTIKYDCVLPVNPTVYTVETDLITLRQPTTNLFDFVGWQDRATSRFVDAVGAGATFVGTDVPVSGDLDLVAVWAPRTISWKNSTSGLSESNGTYRGSWKLALTPKASGLPAGKAVRIWEIDLCIVNPHLYPKTAPCLAVKTNAADLVLSQVRTNYLEATTGRYAVGTNLLANGRAKVAYRFDNLVVRVSASNELYFATAEGVRTGGFLRLGLGEGTDIGRCTEPGGDPESADYRKFCPIYEIYGEAVQ